MASSRWGRVGPWSFPILVGMVAVLAGPAGCASRNQNEYAPPPPPKVTVAHPVERPVTEFVELSGRTQSKARVELKSRVTGHLRSIDFEDGATVQKGDLLFVIEKEPFEAALEAAQAKLAEAEANLKAARESKGIPLARAALLISQANLGVAQLDEARGRQLVGRSVEAREEYDRQVAALKSAQAEVEAKQADLEQAKVSFDSNIALGEASVDNARANVTTARLQLSYTEIHAPIDGKIGRHLVDTGSLVQAEMTLMAVIEDYNPIYVYFTISESQALKFIRLREEKVLPPIGAEPIVLEMGLGNEEGFPHQGLLDFLELGIDPETGTVSRRGTFPNADRNIIPGLYARVRGALGEPRPHLLVPEVALGSDQQGPYLLVVNDQNVVEHRSVRTGIRQEDGMRVIEQGLKADDRVVVNGLLRARPGAKVDPEQGDALAVAGPSGPKEAPAAANSAPPASAPAPAAGPSESTPKAGPAPPPGQPADRSASPTRSR